MSLISDLFVSVSIEEQDDNINVLISIRLTFDNSNLKKLNIIYTYNIKKKGESIKDSPFNLQSKKV